MRNILLSLIALYFSSITLSGQCDNSFTYIVDIDIDNTLNPVSYTDHQVLLTINTMDLISMGKMNADGSDIRFFDDSCNPVCFLIETGLNTASTEIWVKVPTIPASSNATIRLKYGNPSALSVENGECTFDFYEDFNDNTYNFTDSCGSGTLSTDGDYGMVSWSNRGVYRGDFNLNLGSSYTAEAMVMGIGGNWPGLYLIKQTNNKSYSILANTSDARIGVTGGDNDLCSGQNWASTLNPFSNPDGLWSLTWIATGNLNATFPSIGNISSTDVTYALDSPLAVGIGGISSGDGNFMEVDWLRVRKYSENMISSSEGAEMMGEPAEPIPTLSQWGLISLSLLITVFSIVFIRKERGIEIINP